MQRIFLLLVFSCFLFHPSFSQNIDVEHYQYEISLEDKSDKIAGRATIRIKFLTDVSGFDIDLVSPQEGKGMEAVGVFADGLPVDFTHQDNKLRIIAKAKKGDVRAFDIQYSGVPKDGLIISKNKYGERTFFADNWPNRAHHWIPCNDRPDDKASFEFIVTAPSHYQVISNGIKAAERNLGNNTRLTHWKETIPLPTKVMVIGAARFAVKEFADSPQGVPVSAWVYPKDSSKGFYDYGLAPGILKYFADYIGPYPYQKLANVQSKTIFGGMENASAIFYAESSVTGDRSSEDLIAHEIAHQWFGDMVSEKSFAHLWLSEGFASYLANMYLESQYGKANMKQRMEEARKTILDFVIRSDRPVVDSTANLMSLLNANSYQRGSFVLHMLRAHVGDTSFQKMIRTFYERYKGSSAASSDFAAVATEVYQADLGWFFDQWLNRPGVPELSIRSEIEGKDLVLRVVQHGRVYRLSLPFHIETKNGGSIKGDVLIKEKESVFRWPDMAAKYVSLQIDPECELLFREKK